MSFDCETTVAVSLNVLTLPLSTPFMHCKKQIKLQIEVANELQDEIDHLQWQLSQAQLTNGNQPHSNAQGFREPAEAWATKLFDGDDDDVLMAEVDDDSYEAANDAEPGRISTSPIELNATFTEKAGRQLRRHFSHGRGGAVSPIHEEGTTPLATPRKESPYHVQSKHFGSSDEKVVRQLQSKIEEQDDEIAAQQAQYERAMADLHIQMRQKQDLINKLTREEQMSNAALSEHEAQIEQLEDDIDSYAAELRRAADELSRASQTEKEHLRKQKAAKRNEQLLQEAQAQLKALQLKTRSSSDVTARSNGAREELLQMKKRQVSLMRQFKKDEGVRRAEAQRLKKRLAQLQKQRDKQDLEITRLRESNKKQQSVIQAKDNLLRSYQKSSRSPRSSRSKSASTASTPSRRSQSSLKPEAGASAVDLKSTDSMSPTEAVEWLKGGLRSVASQLQAQRVLDDRLSELRRALGKQESKTAERRQVADLISLRSKVGLDQTVGTLGRNLEALQGEADAVASRSQSQVESLDDELDAISVDVAHIKQEVAAARQQVKTGLSFKALVERLPRLDGACSTACLQWAIQALPELETEAELKAKALGQLQGDLRQTEETAKKLQNKLVKQQVDYAAQVSRLQDELRKFKSGEGSLRLKSTSALESIRSRMGDIQHTTYRESKLSSEAKQRDDNDTRTAGNARSDERIKELERQLEAEKEGRRNEVRRMNRYRWEREKLRTQLAAVQSKLEEAQQEGDHDKLAVELQKAQDDCVFYRAQNKELKRRVKELGHSLSRFSGGGK